MVRKADPFIRDAVRSSQSLKSVAALEETSIHPSLIFFEKDMEEDEIKKAVDRLHGRKEKPAEFKNFVITMHAVSDILLNGKPEIGLMFH